MLAVAQMAAITTTCSFVHESRAPSAHGRVDSVSAQEARWCFRSMHTLNMGLELSLRSELSDSATLVAI